MKKILSKFFATILSEKSYLTLRYLYKQKRVPDFQSPETFTEKLLKSKLEDLTELHTTCADKYAVREYVSSKVGSKYLIPLIGMYKDTISFRDNFSTFPEQFALKATHGSGWNEIVFDKSSLDLDDLCLKVNSWLSDNYYHYGYEKQYRDIDPSVVVESLLLGSDGNVPFDYKFYCFGFGGCKKIIIQVDIDRFGEHERVFYDENWKLSDIQILSSKSKLSSVPLVRPSSLDEMLSVVKVLSSEFEFSRIDLYEVLGEIYFGEITFHPESAYGMMISPNYADFELGKLFK